MPTSIVPKMKYNAMVDEARYLIDKAYERLGNKIVSIHLNEEPNRYPSMFKNTITGWLQVYVALSNGYDVSVIWSDYSYGGDQLLWELALIKDDTITHNSDYPDVVGYLSCSDVLENLVKISQY